MPFLRVRRNSFGVNFPSLDGVRGIAILFVLLSHLSNEGYRIFNFSGKGVYGVYLFFVLSAFLLSYPFFNGCDINNRCEWKYFFLRRLKNLSVVHRCFTLRLAFSCNLNLTFNNNVYITNSYTNL